ncbi:MAG TPA: hypothetical protein VKT52_09875, partial [Ktedonobacterales bacterium]|nr:hypothetical protein [Ktedonobacterales bacterium]
MSVLRVTAALMNLESPCQVETLYLVSRPAFLRLMCLGEQLVSFRHGLPLWRRGHLYETKWDGCKFLGIYLNRKAILTELLEANERKFNDLRIGHEQRGIGSKLLVSVHAEQIYAIWIAKLDS